MLATLALRPHREHDPAARLVHQETEAHHMFFLMLSPRFFIQLGFYRDKRPAKGATSTYNLGGQKDGDEIRSSQLLRWMTCALLGIRILILLVQ